MTQEISESQAIDRLLSAFTARGWHDHGNVARALVEAVTRLENADEVRRMAALIPTHFLRNNGINRETVSATVVLALKGFAVDHPDQAKHGDPGVTIRTTQNITINNSAPWIGNVGVGGDIVSAHQYQQQIVNVDALAGRYAGHPDVQEILHSDAATDRQSRLADWLRKAGGVAAELAPKVAAALIQRQLSD